jgi:perosamine synthetase
LFERYKAAFSNIPEVSMVVEPLGCKSNYWLQTLLLDESVSNERDILLAATNDKGLMTRPVWTLMHRLLPYEKCPKMNLSVAESLEKRMVNLPSSAHIGGVCMSSNESAPRVIFS